MAKRLRPGLKLIDSARKLGFLNDIDSEIDFTVLFKQSCAEITAQDNGSVLALQQYRVRLLQEWLQEEDEKKKTASWGAKFKFALLMIAGTLYFGCEGFDGISALLGVFSVPAIILFGAGIVFSLVSIVVFYSFDMVQISKNLGVDLAQNATMVHACSTELKLLKRVRDTISMHYLSASKEQLQEYLALLHLVTKRYDALIQQKISLKESLDHPYIKVANTAMTITAGILYFSGGFFAGQTVALAVITALLGAAAAIPTFWPVLLASLLIGFASFAIYWFVERPGIENFVSGLFGLDKEAIEDYCEKDLQHKSALNFVLKVQIERQLHAIPDTADNGVKTTSVTASQRGILFFDPNDGVSLTRPEAQGSDLESHFTDTAPHTLAYC